MINIFTWQKAYRESEVIPEEKGISRVSASVANLMRKTLEAIEDIEEDETITLRLLRSDHNLSTSLTLSQLSSEDLILQAEGIFSKLSAKEKVILQAYFS